MGRTNLDSDIHGIEPQPRHILTWNLNKVILPEFQSVLQSSEEQPSTLFIVMKKTPHSLREGALLFSQFQRLQSAMVGRLWQRRVAHITAAKKQKKPYRKGSGQDPLMPLNGLLPPARPHS